MLSDLRRMLAIATGILVFTSYMALMTTYRYGPGILLLPVIVLALMPFAERLDRRDALFRKLTSALTFLFVVTLPVIVIAIHLLDAVIFLIIYIQVYSLLHDKRERNYNHILLMSFFLFLASCVMTPSPLIGVALILFVISAAWMMILLEMHVGAGQAERFDTADIVALDNRGLAIGSHQARLLDVRMTGWILVSSAGVLALTALLFFSSPRLEAGFFGTDSDVYMTGITHEIPIDSGGTILQDTAAVMRVEFPEEEDGRFRGEMFWRTTALDLYKGNRWIRQGLSTHPPANADNRDFNLLSSRMAWDGTQGEAFRQPFGFGREVVQRIFLVNTSNEGVPALSMVRSVTPSEGQKDIDFRWHPAHDFTIDTSYGAETSIQYEVSSEIYEPTPNQLRESSANFRRVMNDRDWGVLTDQNLLPETRALVERIVDGAENPYDIVVLLQQYLSTDEYQYSLEIPELPSENPIDAFINGTKTGHCQLYASALALMARSKGIPTRLVSGYRGGRWIASDEAYTVTADTAHVWVEVYFPDYGWIPFDPSPPSPELEGLNIGTLRRALSQLSLQGKMFWYQNVIGFSPEDRVALLKGLAAGVFKWNPLGSSSRPDEEISLTSRLAGLVPLGIIVFVTGFALLAIARRVRRWRRSRPSADLSPDQTRAIQLREKLSEQLVLNGIECEGKTVDELRAAVVQEPWEHTPEALQILESYSAVRFGARPLPNTLFAKIRGVIRAFRPVPS